MWERGNEASEAMKIRFNESCDYMQSKFDENVAALMEVHRQKAETAEKTLDASRQATARARAELLVANNKPKPLDVGVLPNLDTAGKKAFAEAVDVLNKGIKLYKEEIIRNPPMIDVCISCGARATRSGDAEGCGHVVFCSECTAVYIKNEKARIAADRDGEEAYMRAELVVDGYVINANDEQEILAELDEQYGTKGAPFIGCPQCRAATVNYKTTSVKSSAARKEAKVAAKHAAEALMVRPGHCPRCD
jgi:hypothetical protein